MGAAAPLISTPGAPVPPGAEAEWYAGQGGVQLRAALFRTGRPRRGSVVLSPGRTEPIEKYFETIGELGGRGFDVLAHDWRGQGLSQRLLADPMRGHAEGFEPFIADYGALLDAFAGRLERPWFALSHSMGACLTLLALGLGERRLEAAVLSAPMLSIVTAGAPPAVARAAIWLSQRLGRADRPATPSYDPLGDHFGLDRLTHDRRRYLRYKDQLRAHPALALGAVTWGWLDFALKAGAAIAAPGTLEHVDIPVTLVAAGDDKLVLNAASQAAARRLPKGRYVEVPGAYHELLMETDERRALFWAAFDETIDPLSAPPG